MYITYEAAQYTWSFNDKLNRFIKSVKPIPNDLPKPDFMPTKLVRISDMKAVDGSQVNEGYCALSYSWNQSGDILFDETTGKSKRIDEGKHKIIRIYGSYEYVKFEVIIQEICQQFNIKYIWYDQLCINQDDKDEKQHEICNMYHIYENAYCTVALVPDYSKSRCLNESEQQYFKRLWTLEEAIKSKRLLFVGRDKHQWEAFRKFCIMHINEQAPKITTVFLLSFNFFQNSLIIKTNLNHSKS
ncbi:hypothetical protein BDA99DRAFT_541452 [Phascolomyces articulosus]|uniref:Heterokaryon incompatibility domain-containing protein n=1 Tax=Phascolomyces articulosus TaxID=60185 RepID=A0AAD5P9X2_9FUNG|nr:hypothetical protein BDA99DRAFT_541452 [Phascolomyces articulosus]